MLDVIIIGAGAAGLSAARSLRHAGLKLLVLEARERIGGRIWTVTDASSTAPIELGAEFVHGEPPAIFEIARAANLEVIEGTDRRLLSDRGGLRPLDEFWDLVAEVDDQIDPADDETYEQFLGKVRASAFAKVIAKSYVEGFNAARADRIGTAALALEDRAAEDISGDKQFRLRGGYEGVLRWLETEVDVTRIRLGIVVHEIRWRRGAVQISAETKDGKQVYEARRAVITVPLGVLRAKVGEQGAIRFDPALPGKEHTLAHLEMGHVLKVSLSFRERFWEAPSVVGDCTEFGFTLCLDAPFPTWWTQQPLHTNVLTGWAGGPDAEKLLGLSSEEFRRRAVQSLAQTFHLPEARIESLVTAFQFHDWSADPFARGAYSYPGIMGTEAAKWLAEPVDDTLFFAGEATDFRGFSGTVHGALDSGSRVAREILKRG